MNKVKKVKESKYSSGLAIIFNKQILLGHCTGRKINTGFGISKGEIDKNESKIEAAIRETKEEFGLLVPENLIDTKEYEFKVTTSTYNKTVYYYVLSINSICEIGLTKNYIPKEQLQIEEVDRAEFMDKELALKCITKSQTPLIENLIKLNLL
jgi:predicted NUDIX family NTP pyrophosphohydrolase